MDFSYPQLRTEEIRLLTPLVLQQSMLSFKMSCHPRTRATRYTAVSYTWGDGAPTESIFINGQRFFVRCNLWSCLYYMSQDKRAGWTHLWVDAICIDQRNDQERSAQVRVMDVIYRNAFSVSVWLGLPPSAERYRALFEPIKTFDDDGFDWSDSVQELANRSYWGRFWVIQEFLLASDVNIYCGGTRMNWSDFKDLLGRQTGRADYLLSTFNHHHYDTGSWAAWPLLVGRHPDRHPELQQPLYELIINHCNSQCKDPRDRIFALLGLVTPDERGLLSRFFPDYAMNVDDVVIIALSHVKYFNLEYDGNDDQRLFLGLGITCMRRRKKLAKRAVDYDYFGDLPPSRYFWIDDNELGDDGTNHDTGGSYSNTRSCICS